ncbi:glycerol-3-phosphate phosphatase [Galendromus occidentalis]|uniref:Glycerol-3-phosphate phosphatase n=1 Tax=Galendromus occidentalis TaxID=34638 RepID=A0AAJ6QXW5_9ACAR|nr:glycerol-3-phosphate phosphatase [Galendromus occidentalis]
MSSLLTKSKWLELSPKLKYVLSDCDGVLWNGDCAIPGAREFIATLRKDGKRVCFVTNNSTKTREQILEKCTKMKFGTSLEDVYGTAYATAAYLKMLGVGSVYLVGSPALHYEMTALGIRSTGLGPDELGGNWNSWLSIKLEDGIQAVVAGFDEHFSLAKVCRAASYLRNPDCHFIVTNRDQSLPSERKDLVLPGTGCIISSLETAAGRPPIVVGKPYPTMIELLKKQFPDLDPENTLFIGDRLNTDIELGRRQGFKTLLVETGVHNRKDIDPLKAPTYYVPSLNDLYGYMQ